MLNNCITEKNKTTTQTHIIIHIYKVLKQEIYAIKIKHQIYLFAILHFKRYIF